MAEVAAAALLGGELYEYNHDNFKYDRKQRQRKEYKEIDLRIEQAKLWREDVACICDLVQKKSKTYCLVAVLVLSFSMSLWCQGRLPIGTPTWIMLGNQVAAGSGFLFLTLVVWLAMYASVSSQAYSTRLLTQLIRLPIPTWEELEACRTYSSSFEKLEARHMFRIPFITGPQEGLVADRTAALGRVDDTQQTEIFTSRESASPSAESISGRPTATDPWGLEARGDDIYELGCKYGSEVASLRHIKLMRHAAMFWQSYDAFARMSLNIGMNQIMVGLSYFILGYQAIDLEAPFAAFAGVLGLMCLSGAIARLDMSLSRASQVIVDLCLIIGPVFSCLAAYQLSGRKPWTVSEDAHARFYMAYGFFAHGLFLLMLTFSSGLQESKIGDSYPTSFKTVLWSDVFGSVPRQEGRDTLQDNSMPPSSRSENLISETRSKLEAPETDAHGIARQTSQRSAGEIGYYAMDYMEDFGADSHEVECAGAESSTHKRPGLNSFTYEADSGKPMPISYRDGAPPGAADDMRNVQGAPRMWHKLDAQKPGTEFFDASSFFPERSDDEDRGKIVTGHDREAPAFLPQKAFRAATAVVGIVWWLAALYQMLDAFNVVHFADFSDHVVIVGNPPSLLQAFHGRVSGFHPGAPAHKIEVTFPSPLADLRGLSCDAFGHHFVVTDGLATFVGELKAIDASNSSTIDFKEMDHCTNLLGEAFDDTAIACSKTNATDDVSCEVIVLHQNGKRLTTCPIQSHASSNPGQMAEISQQWLHHQPESEQVGWLYLAPDCEDTSPMQCATVGTTHGRVSRLAHYDNQLVPESVLPQGSNTKEPSPSGVVRNFDHKYVGVLQARNNVQVFDMERGMADVGSLPLPMHAKIRSFCVAAGHMYVMSEGPMPEIWRI
mmetsp:Transcript_115450/g.182508  ORF Transcript_115450/g.182508 Transcript_115450/m.182508 type:complete len:890 (-) Transcript_115450:88-2757(-)